MLSLTDRHSARSDAKFCHELQINDERNGRRARRAFGGKSRDGDMRYCRFRRRPVLYPTELRVESIAYGDLLPKPQSGPAMCKTALLRPIHDNGRERHASVSPLSVHVDQSRFYQPVTFLDGKLRQWSTKALIP